MFSHPSIVLIAPPVVKPCEPPAGIARLAAVLRSRGIDCRVVDASLEAILSLVFAPAAATDTWTRRAAGNREANLAALRSPALYANADRYRRAVSDVNRLVHVAGQTAGVNISLSNYTDPGLSPVRSADLVQSARQFEQNPFFPTFEKRLREIWEERIPDIVGFSVNFMSQAVCAFAMAGFVRTLSPTTKIVLGGGLVTSWMRIPGFSNPFDGVADELIAGPGEAALLSLCGADGVDDGVPAGFDYSFFPMDRYMAPGPVLPYSTSSGCYWRRCRFCPERSEKQKFRPADREWVTADIKRLVRQTSPVLIHFLDNALSPAFLQHLIENPPGAPWYGFARITKHLADPGFVRGLKASGCVMLKLGIESGDQAVLDALEKGIDLKIVSRSLEALKGAGIATYVYLLFGTPVETESGARKTLAFARAHAHLIDFFNLAVFNLPATGEDARKLETIAFYPGDLSLYREFVHPGGWDRGRVRRFLAREFVKPASIREIVQNDPAYFTSNHAPFLVMPGKQ